MSKEMMIVFVYDTQLINRESDDLNSAILYFYPAWVSEQQKSALCGQIMGATQFFKSVFNCPEIIALQSGKFAIREYGRYVLAVGTDRNVADWVLEYRAKTLSMLITFFHQDLEALNKVYQTSESISVKLCYMFETYLKILTYSYNLFSNIPKIALPKSASNVFLEAMQILQCCQEIDQVLGGTMLYHNRVVATQLSSNLTKRIVLTDPYRIKSPGEIVQVDYQLPLGVQLLEVYIEGCDYQDLLENATRTKTVHQYLNKKNYNKSIQSTKEPVITFMKRDQSIIFTAVPEEDVDSHSPVNIENNIIPARPLMRPKFLNLHNKTTESEKPIPKPPTTPFYGQTSVCSTPMTDLNKVLYQNVMSICKDPEEANVEEVSDEKAESSSPHEPTKVTKKGTPAKTKSIADPTCPFLKADGSEMSASFREGQTDGKECEWKSVENSSIKNESFDINAINAKSGRENRKGLSLPLKSLSTDSEVFSPVGRNKNCGGVQLTPLMSKLSLLAMEERSSGFCSRGTTPSEYKDFKFTPTQPNYSFLNSSKKSESKFRKPINVQLKKSTLFICGHQDMVVALILEENAGKSKDIIQKLWSICIESLGKLEKQLRQCLETYHGGGSNSSSSQSISSEPYSYLSLDQYWETIQKSGPWDVQELGAVTHLHRDFTSSKNITEILLRDDDCIIYGHQCGQNEIFYRQTATSNAGLPTPADPMGMVPLKARRRLERDQAVVLL